MPGKKTGRPVGRPVVYGEDERPISVSVRIPRNLFDRVKSYAGRHRQSLSELVLDGLKMRLEQEDTRFQSSHDMTYYDNTVLQELAKPIHLMDDHIPFDAELPPTAPAEDNGNTVLQTTLGPAPAPQPTSPCGHPAARWNAKRRVCRDCEMEKARERRANTKRQRPRKAAPVAACAETAMAPGNAHP